MNDWLITPNSSAAQALGFGTHVAKVFIRNKTACVGCSLARFCTLADVAKTYELSSHDFMNEIQQTISSKPISLSGASYEQKS